MQSSQPQHEPVAQSLQTRFGSAQPVPSTQLGAQVRESWRQISPFGQGSSSSQSPATTGRQAATQFLQVGQLAVAQGSQTEPGVQASQKSPQTSAH